MSRFKSLTTKRYLEIAARNNALAVGKLWQRNYYEHIIRDEPDYYQIREYISSNPENWDNDDLRQ
ncbi:MAG: hypothetical protein LLF76_12330 [Planctomycetaceae bacterium]|nr:hypothetical protein [Planctomycetaceae bacterium]